MIGTLVVSLAHADDVAPNPPATPTAAQITEKWSAYFDTLNKLPSWSYEAQMQISEGDAKNPSAPQKVINDIKVKFAKNKNLFRHTMQVREDIKGDFQKVTAAYNGQKYQLAVHNPTPTMIGNRQMHDLMQQSTQPIANDLTGTGVLHFALTVPFVFADEGSNDKTLAMWAKPEMWTSTREHIQSIAPATWENQTGYLLTFSPSATDENMARGEVFIEASSALPLHCVSFDKNNQITSELKSTLQPATTTAPAILRRTDIVHNAEPGKPAGKGFIEVTSINLAPNFAPDFFKIPASSVEIVTEGNKVVYSRYPMPKEASQPKQKPAKAGGKNKK